MDADGSITRWINQLKAGDRDAAEALWETYFRRSPGSAPTPSGCPTCMAM